VVIFATGFYVTDIPMAHMCRGRDGVLLSETWNGSPQAYMGTAVAGFPNLFMLVGPNTGLGHNSIVFMIEAQITYLLSALRDAEAVTRAVAQAVERLGGLDVLVNNAGVGDAHDAGEAPDDSAEAIVDINLFGAWRVTAAALPALLESRGRVINVASGLALVNVPFASAYAASKRALAAWSDALRMEYGGTISVTTVYPGYIRTPIHDPPAERGVSLDDLVPAEPIGGTVKAIVRS